MKVTKTKDITKLTVNVSGRVDAVTAPELAGEVAPALDCIENLVINLAELEYISSAGMRVLLQFQKTMMAKKGLLTLRGMSEDFYKIFRETGLTNVFNITK